MCVNLQPVSICATLPQGPRRRPTSCCHHSDDFICAAMCANVYFALQNSHSTSPMAKTKGEALDIDGILNVIRAKLG